MSHHHMGAFFSGEDTETLRSEGNDTNCYVSLVVDTPGNYVAAVTRKVQVKSEVTVKNLGTSYEFFGEGEVKLEDSGSTTTKIINSETIQYFPLTVEIEKVDNPLEYLDKRFEFITNNKSKYIPPVTKSADWFNSFPEYSANVYTPTLFNKKDMEILNKPIKTNNSKGEFTDKLIKSAFNKLITGDVTADENSMLVNYRSENMINSFNSCFGGADNYIFTDYAETYVSWVIESFLACLIIDDESVPGLDDCYSASAQALIQDLKEFKGNIANPYIDYYIELLERYIV